MIPSDEDIENKFPNEAEGKETLVTGLLLSILFLAVHKLSVGL